MSTDYGEPWKADTENGEIYDRDGNAMCDTDAFRTVELEERVAACVNFCQHVPTETLEALAKEHVGAATLVQWIRRNPTYLSGEGMMPEGFDVCIECNHAITSLQSSHAEECLLAKALDIIGKDV